MIRKQNKDEIPHLIDRVRIEEFYDKALGITGDDATTLQSRGYLLQDLLYSILYHENLDPRTSYRPKGEELDGSFYLAHRTFLLEAKWIKDPVCASTIYEFQGKVGGKLLGTIGIFVSMSGYSEDAPDALEKGKTIDILLFDQSDMDLVFRSTVRFEEVLDFKLRQAGETGKAYVPFKLQADIAKIETTKVMKEPVELIQRITYQPILDSGLSYGKDLILILCEGSTDALILELLFNRLIQKIFFLSSVAIQISPVGGMTNWRNKLPELINLTQNILKTQPEGIIVLFDKDSVKDRKIEELVQEIKERTDKIALSVPVHVAIAEPNIESWVHVDKSKARLFDEFHKLVQKTIESLDIDRFTVENSTIKGIIDFIIRVIPEDKPIWETDAEEAVERAMEDAEWDYDEKTVTLLPREDHQAPSECKSIDELKYKLFDIAVNGANNSMPFEGGAPVFEIDYLGLIEETLMDNYMKEINKLGWEI